MINDLYDRDSVVTSTPGRQALIGAVVDFYSRANAGSATDGGLL
jgi:hypothetical protein